MKGELVFETLGGVDAAFILEADPHGGGAPAEAVTDDKLPRKEKRPPLHSGWVAAIVCLFVGLGVYGGMLWLGQEPGHTPVGGTQGETYVWEDVTFEDRQPEYIEPCDFTFTITGMEIDLIYLRTENDELDGCLVDVYRDYHRNVEYRFFSRTRVLKRFHDEDRRVTKGLCDFDTVVENARQVVYDHAWLFWSHNHEAILKEAEDYTYIYERGHTIDSRFEKETLSMAFNSDGQLYSYTYEDHGFFSQCVARSNVELFMEIYNSLPTDGGYLQTDRDDRLCYVCEEIVAMPPEEQITDEEGNVIGPGCGDHKHVFTSLPILSINPPKKPPLPSEMIYGFSCELVIETPKYIRAETLTVAKDQAFYIDGGMYFDKDFDTKPYNGSDDLFPTVVIIAEDGTVIESCAKGGMCYGYASGQKRWSASRWFKLPADAPTGKYDVKISYGDKYEIYEDVLTVTQ